MRLASFTQDVTPVTNSGELKDDGTEIQIGSEVDDLYLNY